jgi:hypothetical protein
MKKSADLELGMKGFFATVNPGYEKRATKEIFNALNRYVEIVYPQLDVVSEFKQRKDNALAEKRRKIDEATEIKVSQ